MAERTRYRPFLNLSIAHHRYAFPFDYMHARTILNSRTSQDHGRPFQAFLSFFFRCSSQGRCAVEYHCWLECAEALCMLAKSEFSGDAGRAGSLNHLMSFVSPFDIRHRD